MSDEDSQNEGENKMKVGPGGIKLGSLGNTNIHEDSSESSQKQNETSDLDTSYHGSAFTEKNIKNLAKLGTIKNI